MASIMTPPASSRDTWRTHTFSVIRGVSGLRSVGLLRSDTKRFCDGVLFDPQKRNLNSSNRGTFEGVSGLQSGGPFRRYMFPHGRLPLGRWKYPPTIGVSGDAPAACLICSTKLRVSSKLSEILEDMVSKIAVTNDNKTL